MAVLAVAVDQAGRRGEAVAVGQAGRLGAVAVGQAGRLDAVAVGQADQPGEALAVDPADQLVGPADQSEGRVVQLEDQADQSQAPLAGRDQTEDLS